MPPWALLRASESRGRPLTSRPRDARGAARACRCALRGPRASRGRARTARLRAHRGTRGAPAAAHTAAGTAVAAARTHGPPPAPQGVSATRSHGAALACSKWLPYRTGQRLVPRAPTGGGLRGHCRHLPSTRSTGDSSCSCSAIHAAIYRADGHTHDALAGYRMPESARLRGPVGSGATLVPGPATTLVVAAAPPSRLCVTRPLDGRHHHAPVRQKSKGAAGAQSCHPGDRMLARVGAGRGAGEGLGVLPWAAGPSTAGDAAAHP